MTDEEIKDFRKMIPKLIGALEHVVSEDRIATILRSINNNIVKLRYQHKTAYTLKEVAENTGINIKTINRYAKSGKLIARREEGMITVVLLEDLIDFLNGLEKVR